MKNLYWTKFYKMKLSSMLSCILCTSVFILIGCTEKPVNQVSIRIGWQVAWATQGQIAQVLKHTNILDLNGLSGEFKGFTYGAPLNEAALAGAIDVGFVADQLGVSLVARGDKFKIVARLMDFRAALIVPPESGINSVSDLRGKTIGIPFGSTTHRIVLGMLGQAGLDPSKDVKIINLDIAEQAGVVLAGTNKKWKGDIDALASWDPNIAIFVSRGYAKVLEHEKGLGIVYMSEDFVKNHSDAAASFLKAYMEAYYYYASHQQQADQWFAEEARIKFDPSLLRIAGSFEPNLNTKDLGEINVWLSDQNIRMIQDGANFAFQQKLINYSPQMDQSIDQSILQSAIKQLQTEKFDSSKILSK